MLDNVSPIRIDAGDFHLKIREKMNMNLTEARENMRLWNTLLVCVVEKRIKLDSKW